ELEPTPRLLRRLAEALCTQPPSGAAHVEREYLGLMRAGGYGPNLEGAGAAWPELGTSEAADATREQRIQAEIAAQQRLAEREQLAREIASNLRRTQGLLLGTGVH